MTIVSETETVHAFRQVVHVDAHTLHADVSTADGGAGSAPTPHDYFDTSLATCKALTAAWFAKRKGFALDKVIAKVTRDASRERQGTYVLKVELSFEGALTDEEKRAIYDAAAKCPLHKLMTATKVEIDTAPLAG